MNDIDSSASPGGRGGSSFSQDVVDDVRHAVSITRVVEDHVTLKRAGRTLKGLCPFHSEKTPSFTVDEAKGFYYCFGCGAGGDVFRFVMQVEALSFPEAIRSLAEKAGVRLPERRADGPGDGLRERVLAANQGAQELFARALAGEPGRAAREYLSARGIGDDVIEEFGLGWAPESWDFVLSRLTGRFELRELTAAGLAVPRPSGQGAYDRFRSRVTFPIRAVSERVLGFGGRIIGDGEPKYLNSPETPVYSKGRHLYGLDRAKGPIRQGGRAILVEGYLDAISLHAHGVKEAVAVLGTALTPEQARLLGRFARTVVVNFDGDAAGLRAAKRSIEVLLGEGLDVRVVELPNGEDPDDFVRRVGPEAYRRAIDTSKGFVDFLVELAASEHDLGSPSGRVTALNDVLPFIVQVEDRLLRSELADAACHGLGLRAELVRAEIARALRRGQGQLEVPVEAQDDETTVAERTLLSWLLTDDRARNELASVVDRETLARFPHAELFSAIVDAPPGQLDVARLVDDLPDDASRRLVSSCAVDSRSEPLDEATLSQQIRSFIEELGGSSATDARRRKADVDRLLADALRRGDHESARQLMAEAQELGKVMHQ